MTLLRLSQVFLLTLPFQIALRPTSEIDLSMTRIFALLVFLFWLGGSLFKKKILIPSSVGAMFLVSFIFLSCISFLWAENQGWALRRATFFLSFFPLFFVFSSLIRELGRKAVSALLSSFVFGATAAALVGIVQSAWQIAFGPGPVFHFWVERVMPIFLGSSFSASVAEYPSLLANIGGTTVLRATAFFPDPHMFALYMGLALPLALGFAILADTPQRKLFFYSAFFLIVIADLLSFSRGAYLGLGFGALLTGALLLRRAKRVRTHIFIAAAFSGLLGMFLADTPVQQRLLSSFSLSDGSNQGRVALWSEATEHISERPFLGYGIGNYPLTVKPTAEYREPIYAHNLFLDIATETGIVGAVLFFLAFLSSFLWLLKTREVLFFASAVSLSIIFGHSLFELPLYSVHVLPVLLLLFSLQENQERWGRRRSGVTDDIAKSL